MKGGTKTKIHELIIGENLFKQWGEPQSFGRNPGRAMLTIGAGYTGTCRPMVVPTPGAGVIRTASHVSRRHDLSRTGQLFVIDIASIVDDGDPNPLPLAECPRSLNIGMRIVDRTVDRGFFEMPLLREHLPPSHFSD